MFIVTGTSDVILFLPLESLIWWFFKCKFSESTIFLKSRVNHGLRWIVFIPNTLPTASADTPASVFTRKTNTTQCTPLISYLSTFPSLLVILLLFPSHCVQIWPSPVLTSSSRQPYAFVLFSLCLKITPLVLSLPPVDKLWPLQPNQHCLAFFQPHF